MKNLKFVFLTLILILTLVLTLSACGDGNGEEESETSVEAETDNPEEDNLFRRGLLPAATNGSFGYLNKKGNWVIEPQFTAAEEFTYNGYAWVQVGNKWGVIDTDGDYVIIPMLDVPNPDREFDPYGLTLVGKFVQENGSQVTKFGYINGDGTYAVEPQFNTVEELEDELTGIILVEVSGRWGWINAKGEYLANPRFDIRPDFNDDGIALVCAGGQYGYMDKSGEMLVEPQYSNARPVSADGLAAVAVTVQNTSGGGSAATQWGYIDMENTMVINARFDDAATFADNGLAAVMENKNGQTEYRYIDLTGAYINDAIYQQADDFVGNYAVVSAGGKNALVDAHGEYELLPHYDSIQITDVDSLGEPLGFSLITTQISGTHNVYKVAADDTLEILFADVRYPIAGTRHFESGYMIVQAGSKFGAVDATGQLVIPAKYDGMTDFNEDGLATVQVDGLWGVINTEGEFVIQPQFAAITMFDDDYFQVTIGTVNSRWGVVDMDGEFVIRPMY